MRDEERGTQELSVEGGLPPCSDGAGARGEDGPVGQSGAGRQNGPGGQDGPGEPSRPVVGIDGIPEQARPHPDDEPLPFGLPGEERPERDDAVQGTPPSARSGVPTAHGGPPTRPRPRPGEEARARGRATGGTMSGHERNSEDDAQSVQGTQHAPQDRNGARAMFVELRTLKEGSPQYAELRNQLVRMHLPLVEHLARRFRNRGEPLDDLTQVATIGLIKSVDRFDPDRGVEFSTYATPTVVGEIKRHFRDKGWAVRVPRRLQELRLALTTATAELSQLHGRSPTVHELAEKLSISEEEVLEGLESANAYSTLSLDVPDTDDESPAVADTLGAEDEALEGVEYRESLKPLLEDLPPREKRILLLRFFGNMTQSQIAQEVGISQMHVSRLLARTLAQLREKLLVEE
ncbi:SigB/SigF/SigG family RNA polymerase sigma factor [Streptomyces carpinensis]|uniref:SigB/SigF/SigG family RNA polymerase sigma factor n=1 Tax=Streptomyces carpinensis TaxID=66369 RepID=A0ABV1W5A3_9ACTN|nr:SigB/SigF/SigG family RNA polymerase sigma factor [Streptomyces carpinensis]